MVGHVFHTANFVQHSFPRYQDEFYQILAHQHCQLHEIVSLTVQSPYTQNLQPLCSHPSVKALLNRWLFPSLYGNLLLKGTQFQAPAPVVPPSSRKIAFPGLCAVRHTFKKQLDSPSPLNKLPQPLRKIVAQSYIVEVY